MESAWVDLADYSEYVYHLINVQVSCQEAEKVQQKVSYERRQECFISLFKQPSEPSLSYLVNLFDARWAGWSGDWSVLPAAGPTAIGAHAPSISCLYSGKETGFSKCSV